MTFLSLSGIIKTIMIVMLDFLGRAMNPAKYIAITDELEKLIVDRRYSPGELLPSQLRISEQFGISRSCAQKVVDELDARNLILRVPGKGIFVREEASKIPEFKKIAYLVPSFYRTSYSGMDNYGLNIMLGIEEKLREFGAQFIFYRYDESKPGLLKFVLKDIDADGYIIWGREPVIEEVQALGRSFSSKIVLVESLNAGHDIACVLPNFFDAFSRLIKQLQARKREKLFFLYSERYSWQDDIMALKSLYESSDIKFIDFSRPDVSCWIEDDTILRDAVFKIVDNGLPDVMLFFSDWPAMKSIKYMKEKGVSVPDDVEVIGSLNFRLAEVCEPPLTSMAVDPELIGRRAVEQLRRMILEGVPPQLERVPMTLVERASTKNE